MKKLFILILVLSSFFFATAQEWHWQNPLPQGNDLNCVKFVNSNFGYAVGWNGTILKTVNGGTNWTIKTLPESIIIVSVFFNNVNTGYVAGIGGNILKTIDGGINWVNQISGTSATFKCIYFTDANTGYACGTGGTILKTTNGGINWASQTSGTTSSLRSIYFTSANTGYIVGLNGTILKTTNAGINWTIQPSGTLNLLASVCFTDMNHGYAVGESGLILKTVNGGTNWASQTTGSPYWFNSVCFTDLNTGYIVGDGGALIKTTDGGTTWINQNSGTLATLTSVNFIPIGGNNTGYAVGEGGMIIKTTDGGTNWSKLIFGTRNYLSSVFFTDSNTGYACGQVGIILKTTDGGVNWVSLISGPSSYLNSIYFPNSLIGYAVGEAGKIIKTTDGGSNWVNQNSGTPYNLNTVNFINPIAGYSSGGGGTILKTDDGGSSWYTQNSGTTNELFSIVSTSGNIGYAVGVSGTILKTIDGGTSWTSQSSGTIKDLFAVFFQNVDTGYVVGGDWSTGQNGTILKTVNGGLSWTTQLAVCPEMLTSVFFLDVNHGYAVGYSGIILRTTNGGTNWTTQTSGTSDFLSSVYFTDSITGYAVGEGGVIISSKPGINPPQVDFTWSAPCTSGSVLFTPDSTVTNIPAVATWFWDFGDPSTGANNISTLQNPYHYYSTPGSYYVSLTITDTAGLSNAVVHLITVNPAPEAQFTMGSNICSGNAVLFTDQSSTSVGSIINWNWDFGDPASGTTNTSVLQNPTHTYNSSGTYIVKLIAGNSEGCYDTLNQDISVLPPPVADFSFPSACNGTPVQFNDLTQSGSGSIVNWNWDFGDPVSGSANASMLQNPVHLFSSPGAYSVQLIVQTSSGCNDTVVKTVQVNTAPTANAGPDQYISVGTSTVLSGQANGGSGNYSWHWEPSALLVNPDVQNPVTVNLSSTTVFTLTVLDNSTTCTGEDQVTVTVIGGPLSILVTANPNPVCLGNTVQLDALVSGGSGSNNYSWSSNPAGFNSTLPNPVVQPVENTTYIAEVNDGNSIVVDSVQVLAGTCPGQAAAPQGPDVVDLAWVHESEYITAGTSDAVSYEWEISPPAAGRISGTGFTAIVTWSRGQLGEVLITVRGINQYGQGMWSEGKITMVYNTVGFGLNESSETLIFPNPTNGSFYIRSPKAISKVEILDNLGKQLVVCKPSGNNEYSFPTLANGVYFIRIYFLENDTTLKKLIISH